MIFQKPGASGKYFRPPFKGIETNQFTPRVTIAIIDSDWRDEERWPHTRRTCRPAMVMAVSRRMPEKTLFEKICAKEIPAKIIFEDDLCVAFHDISPQAPLHVLIIPRKPIPRVASAGAEDVNLLGHLLRVAGHLARAEGVDESGFRLVINNGKDGGEAVPHLHVHLLAGRRMEWPPG